MEDETTSLTPDIDTMYDLYCVSSRIEEKRSGIELQLSKNEDNTCLYVHPYWKKSPKIKFFEAGDSIKITWGKWKKAIEEIGR